MSTPSLAAPAHRRTASALPLADATVSTRARGQFARVRERFVAAYGSAWAFSSQPEHLLACATWGEMDPDDTNRADDALGAWPDE